MILSFQNWISLHFFVNINFALKQSSLKLYQFFALFSIGLRRIKQFSRDLEFLLKFRVDTLTTVFDNCVVRLTDKNILDESY